LDPRRRCADENGSLHGDLVSAEPAHVTVDWATVDGTGAAGTAFLAASGTLTFPAGTTTRTIPVTIYGNTRAEPKKTFSVVLSSNVNATIAYGHGIALIVNDDYERDEPAGATA